MKTDNAVTSPGCRNKLAEQRAQGNSQRIRAALFDVDGTLTDSMYIWENAGEALLHRHNIAPPPGLKRSWMP